MDKNSTLPDRVKVHEVMVLFSSFVVIQHIPLRMVVISLGVVGLIVVWFFVPTAEDDPVKSTDSDGPLPS